MPRMAGSNMILLLAWLGFVPWSCWLTRRVSQAHYKIEFMVLCAGETVAGAGLVNKRGADAGAPKKVGVLVGVGTGLSWTLV